MGVLTVSETVALPAGPVPTSSPCPHHHPPPQHRHSACQSSSQHYLQSSGYIVTTPFLCLFVDVDVDVDVDVEIYQTPLEGSQFIWAFTF